jgi:rhamnose transport system ATP-binding protein
MRKRAAALLLQLESTIDPRTPLNKLSIAEKHLVQIARALTHEARIVIMDEPTAALSKKEADDLLRIIARLRSEGRAVLFISHKFEEVFAIADRYAVFRDGATVGEGLIAETNVDELIQRMAGRAVTQAFPKSTAAIGREVLRVEHLCREPEYSDVSFHVRAGEVLGVYGLVGAGRSNVMRTIFGLGNADSGEIMISGRKNAFKHPDAAIRAGIAYVPEDRQGQGAILSHTIADNIALPSLQRFAEYGLVNALKLATTADDWTKRLNVKCASANQLAQELSGGNQQKVVLAKWLMTKPQLLILDEPTKGIDIGAKAAVHQLIRELAEQGIAVVLVSSELPEVLGMADRIVVMRRGRIRGDFVRSEVNAEDVLRAAAA